jgi:hypothetical protein
VKGKYSGREFDPDNYGGAIQYLDWKTYTISKEGIADIEVHLSRFSPDTWNEGMVVRLNRISKGELAATDYDLRFYSHELREFERFKSLGYEKGPAPEWVWDNAPAATLEDFKVAEIDIINGEKVRTLYHPDVQK